MIPGYTALIPPNSPPASLLGLSSPAEHSQRRRLWDKALNGAAIRGYQESLEGRVKGLVEQLVRRVGDYDDEGKNENGTMNNGDVNGRVDLAKWLSFFSWVSLFGSKDTRCAHTRYADSTSWATLHTVAYSTS